MNKTFLHNLIIRAFSAIFFIPLIIIPIILGGYFLFLIYLILLTIIIIEISLMYPLAEKKTYLFLYSFLCIFTFFSLIILITTEKLHYLKIIEIIFIIWIFDTSSYLGGKLFNGKKLMPNISKGKTFNGLFSGITISLMAALLYSTLADKDLLIFTSIAFLTIVLAFFGDILASLLKRSVNIKDTGNIIPGHGGMIDRMDSFILVFFFFAIFIMTNNKII